MHFKNLLFTVLLGTFLLLTDARIDAGFHGTGLICSKCHTMHYSEDGGAPPGSDLGGPFEYLLLKKDVSALCLVCHDNNGFPNTPDVYGADSNGLTERAAGYFGTIDTVNPNGHNLGLDKLGSSNLCLGCHFGPPFNDAKVGCTDCHEAHGRDPNNPQYRYRNLQWASAPGSESVITAFVNPAFTHPDLPVYEQSNIGYAAPSSNPSSWREVTNMCLDCHHTFSGDLYTRPSGHPIKHPVTDSERDAWEPISNPSGATDPLHWANGTGIGFDEPDAPPRLPFIVSGATSYAQAIVVAQTNEVFCLTCHKAHGSDNNTAMRWPYRSDSNLGCQQCHEKGN